MSGIKTTDIQQKTLKANVKALRALELRAKDEFKPQIKDLTTRYINRSIPNVKTVLNVAEKLADKNKNTNRAGQKQYEKVVSKYNNATPITGKIERELSRKRALKDTSRTYQLNTILFKSKYNDDGTEDIRNPKVNTNVRSSFAKRAGKRKYAGLVQFYIGSLKIKMKTSEYERVQTLTDKLVRLYKTKEDEINYIENCGALIFVMDVKNES
mgnify:CR=1 FL=1